MKTLTNIQTSCLTVYVSMSIKMRHLYISTKMSCTGPSTEHLLNQILLHEILDLITYEQKLSMNVHTDTWAGTRENQVSDKVRLKPVHPATETS